MIQIRTVTIISHQDYWNCKNQLSQIQDAYCRGVSSELDLEFLRDLQEACDMYENEHPKRLELLKLC